MTRWLRDWRWILRPRHCFCCGRVKVLGFWLRSRWLWRWRHGSKICPECYQREMRRARVRGPFAIVNGQPHFTMADDEVLR